MATTVRPRRASRLQDVHQVLLGRGVDAGDRLVEQVQVRLGGQGAGEEDAPPLAARQAPDLGPQVTVHADLLERVRDGAAVVRAWSAHAPEARVATHHDDVADGDREGPVDQLGLRHVRDAPGLAARWARRGPRSAPSTVGRGRPSASAACSCRRRWARRRRAGSPARPPASRARGPRGRRSRRSRRTARRPRAPAHGPGPAGRGRGRGPAARVTRTGEPALRER